ncbi:MAG: MFS transporter [Caldilineaceae bacterium]
MIRMKTSTGMTTFTIIWFGQLISLLGTGMSRFALLIWAYQQTGQATTLAMLGFFAWLPFVLIGPLAGVWVDRYNRRWIMMIADLGAGLATIVLARLYFSGDLQVWHLYGLEVSASVFEAFQLPAFAAATSTLLPKQQYARANGMRVLARDTSQVFAPLAGGALLAVTSLGTILLVDVATFIFGVSVLLFVRIPAPKPLEMAEIGQTFWRQFTLGIAYLRQRPGLMGLAFLFFGIHLFATLTYFSVLPALILARSNGDEVALGMVQAALGGAGIVGGIIVSVVGLPKRKIHAILLGCALSFLLGDFLFAIGQTLPSWLTAACVSAIFIPFISTANQTIWQEKVAPALQGRIFAARNAIQNASFPLGYLLAGPLADRVFEPAMRNNGALASVFGWLVGTGPGAGIGMMFVCTAILGGLMSLSGYLVAAVRNVEVDLADYEE